MRENRALDTYYEMIRTGEEIRDMILGWGRAVNVEQVLSGEIVPQINFALADLNKQSVPYTELSARSAQIASGLTELFQHWEADFGVQVTGFALDSADPSDKELIGKYERMSAATYTPAEQQTAGAAMPQEGGKWICPACNAENTGKFCEYCGTKKPE